MYAYVVTHIKITIKQGKIHTKPIPTTTKHKTITNTTLKSVTEPRVGQKVL